jgi:hypothetical protein
LVALVITFASSWTSAETVGITSQTVTKSEIALEDAVQIYTGKVMFWPDGSSVVLVILPRDNPVSREFILVNLGMSPYQFYESLDISINVRKNRSVIRAVTENEVIKIVRRYPGSIGYTSEFVYYNYKDEVKKLRIKL